MELIKNEKSPKVIRFRGKAIKFRIGRKIIDIKESTAPPKIKVVNPPEILTPLKS